MTSCSATARADHFLDVFRTYYGPMLKAFEALDDAGREAFTADLRRLLSDAQHRPPTSIAVPGAYLQVVATRAP